MAEATIVHLIEEVRAEGRERKKDTKENTAQIASLNKTFNDYFTMLKRQSLDAEENRRDSRSSGAGAGATAAIAPADKEGGGFLGILAGILAVGGALVVGFVEGFINAARDTFKALRILTGKLFRPIIRTLRLDKFVMLLRTRFAGFLGLGVDGKPTVNTSKLIKGILNPARGFTYLAEGLRSFLGGIGRQFTRLGNASRLLGKELTIPFKAANEAAQFVLRTAKNALIPLRLVFTGLDTFFKDIGSLGQQLRGSVKVVEDVPKQAGVISRFFSSLGQTFRALIAPLQGIFNVFRTIGRVVFFPLTIIMTIFDAIRGFSEGFKEEGVLGGILGAIGGIFSGLIGMPLDLLKSAVGWIAGKLGFENFQEQLASFSFAEIIQDIFIGLAELLNNIVGFITDSFGAVGNKIASFFGFGDDAEPSAVNKRAREAAKPKVMTPKKPRVTYEKLTDDSLAGYSLEELEKLNRGESLSLSAERMKEIDAARAAYVAEKNGGAPSVDASQQNNVNITQTHDVAATDDTDKKPN